MRLIVIRYPERRLEFFKEQLAAAYRRLDWSMKHNPDCDDHAEKGEAVSCYEWAVKLAEAADAAPVVRCRDCKHWNRDGNGYGDDESHCTNPDGLDNYARPDDFCSYGERRGDTDG